MDRKSSQDLGFVTRNMLKNKIFVVRSCEIVCSGHGNLVGGVCYCHDGYIGNTCEGACSNNGDLVNEGKAFPMTHLFPWFCNPWLPLSECVCRDPYSGKFCNETCSGLGITDLSNSVCTCPPLLSGGKVRKLTDNSIIHLNQSSG